MYRLNVFHCLVPASKGFARPSLRGIHHGNAFDGAPDAPGLGLDAGPDAIAAEEFNLLALDRRCRHGLALANECHEHSNVLDPTALVAIAACHHHVGVFIGAALAQGLDVFDGRAVLSISQLGGMASAPCTAMVLFPAQPRAQSHPDSNAICQLGLESVHRIAFLPLGHGRFVVDEKRDLKLHRCMPFCRRACIIAHWHASSTDDLLDFSYSRSASYYLRSLLAVVGCALGHLHVVDV